MIQVILTAIIGFVSTNIDDLFLLMFLFSQVGPRFKKRDILWGQYLGLGSLTLFSFCFSYGIGALLVDYVHLLGIIPMMIGLKLWWDQRQIASETADLVKASSAEASSMKAPRTWGVLPVMLLIVSGGADNIGVYASLFSHYALADWLLVLMVFILLVPIWCHLGEKMGNNPLIKAKIEKYELFLLPLVFLLLGFAILLKWL
ncbi:cadmium resistance transporter [Enterococcus sp. LJL98]